jgi:hypothetical protein
MDDIWFNNPKIILENWRNVFPLNWTSISYHEKINSIARLIIIIAIILMFINGLRLYSIIIIVILSVVSVIMYDSKQKEFKEEFNILTRDGPSMRDVFPLKTKKKTVQEQIIDEIKGTTMVEPSYDGRHNEFDYYSNQHGRGMSKNYTLQNFGSNGHEINLRKVNAMFS